MFSEKKIPLLKLRKYHDFSCTVVLAFAPLMFYILLYSGLVGEGFATKWEGSLVQIP